MPTPHCGHCQYNLTGIEDNRCPECGWLFIEAGVKIVGAQRRDRRKHIWLAAILGGFLLAGISVSYIMMTRARMQAALAQQQAAIARQQATLAMEQIRLDSSQEFNLVELVRTVLSRPKELTQLNEDLLQIFDSLPDGEKDKLFQLRKKYEAHLLRRRADRETGHGDVPDAD